MSFEWIAWLGNIIKLIGDLIPQREKIPPTHRGILYRGMTKVIIRWPGVYWYWPWRSEMHQLCICQQTLWLEEQDVTTADGKVVKCRGTVTYRIIDKEEAIIKAAVETWEITDQIDDEAMAVYCEFIGGKNFDEIQQNRSEANKELTRLVRSRLHEYGVKVVRAQLTSFATGFPLLHMGAA